MKYQTYTKYKASVIKDIGKIPHNWSDNKIKFLLGSKITDGPHETPIFIDEGYPFLSVDSIQNGELIFENCRFISEEDYKKFKTKCDPKIDDIFLGKAASIGKIARVKVEFKFSIWSPLALLRPDKKKLDSRFFEYALKSDYSQDQIDNYATSNTQKNISMDDIPKIQIVTPSLEEQQKIADFLDKKTLQIDDLIKKDKQLIELLKERRIALINKAVTKGLDDKAKLVDSGVDWIGEIPEGWEVRKIKTILSGEKDSIKTGPFGTQLKIDEMEDVEFKVYNQKNVIRDDEKGGENYISEYKYRELTAFRIKPLDVLITTRGTIGKCMILSKNPEKGVLHPCLMKLRPSGKLFNREFLKIIIQDTDLFVIQIMLQSNATTIEVIYQENLKNIIMPCPPVEEQACIVEYIKKQTNKIDCHLAKVKRRIGLLEEYKKSLIYNTVTGKIKVC